MKRLIAVFLILSIFLQPFVLVSPVSAETVDMQYTDPDHLHAPKKLMKQTINMMLMAIWLMMEKELFPEIRIICQLRLSKVIRQ